MMKDLMNKYIVNESDSMDWAMYSSTFPIQKADKSSGRDMINRLNEGTEYMIIKDYESDKESELSIIVKDRDDYYFVTDAQNK